MQMISLPARTSRSSLLLIALFAASSCQLAGSTRVTADLAMANAVRLTDDGRSYTRLGLGWSPDGTHVLFLKQFEEGHQLWLMRADGSEAKAISKVGWEGSYGWSPDSTKIAYSYAEKRDNILEASLHLYDLESGQLRRLASGYRWVQFEDWTGYATIEWTRDSRQFAMLIKRSADEDSRGGSYLFDAETGRVTELTPGHCATGQLYPGSWSPDGGQIALVSQSTVSSKPRIWVCNRDGSSLHPITAEDWDVCSDPRWDPSGEWIAFATTHERLEDEKQQGLCDLWLIRPDGTDAHPIAQGSSPSIEKRMSFYRPEWTANGRYVLCQGTTFDMSGTPYEGVYLVDPSAQRVIPVLRNDPDTDQLVDGFIEKISSLPTGSRIAFNVSQYTVLGRKSGEPTYRDRRDIVYCYDTESGALQELLRTRPAEDGTAAWYPGYNWKPLLSPDCQRLLFTTARVVSLSDWQFEPDIWLADLAGDIREQAPSGKLPPGPAGQTTSPRAMLIFPLHRRASEIADVLPEEHRGICKVDVGLNALVVSATDGAALNAFRRDVELLDRSVPQVMVDVLVVELSSDASKNLGLDWEYVRGSLSAALPIAESGVGEVIYRGVGTFDRSFFSKLSMLEEQGLARVRANPRVLARCGSPATINIRRTDNFFFDAGTDYQGKPVRARSDISADIILRITPHVLASGDIAMAVDATVDSFIFGGRDDLPDTTRRQAITDVLCRDGETIVIGGLTQEEQTVKRHRTPLLGDLPLLGQLFRHTSRSSKDSTLVILITPRTGIDSDERDAAGW